ncbi:MAG TPA: electron transfer flavoprotein subunit alpha/FixB family protein, partial [Spirochaetia bacterium]|nr:electron transfer flavoprotein subunit alpha/FixB family protein [Spirochaetia bacterium]
QDDITQRAPVFASTGIAATSSRGAVWTYIEPDEKGSLEILGEARRIADAVGTPSIAILCGLEPDDALIHTLSRHGATGVLVLQAAPRAGSEIAAGSEIDSGSAAAALLHHHRDATLIASAARLRRPRTILIAASLVGRTVSALAAGLLGAGLTADCTGLRLETADAGDHQPTDPEPEVDAWPGPALLQIRPALGGNILATIVSTARAAGLPEMATVRSGVFPLRVYDQREHEVPGLWDTETVPLAASDWTRAPVRTITDAPALEDEADGRTGADPDARVIVAVGAGIGSQDRLDMYITPLVGAIARAWRITTSLACSRAVVDAGILPYEYQIGQTGKSVRPALYVALGISGAIQHRLGMEHSARVLSVNPDPEAPIHAVSDYSIVGTIEEAVPLLLQALAAHSTGTPQRGTLES